MAEMQLVIPMAGRGSRFAAAGYRELKPLIPIHGVPMISVVAANLLTPDVGHIILVCQRETMETVDLLAAIGETRCRVSVVSVDTVTDGPASTVEVAYPLLDMNKPLVIANSDQYVDADLEPFYRSLSSGEVDGSVLCMRDTDPKWSYAKLDEHGFVQEIIEKQVISPYATVGIYGYSRAKLAFQAFTKMKDARDKTNGEYYVGPSYNYLVRDGYKINIQDLGQVSSVMYGLGIPEDLNLFLAQEVSRKAVATAGSPR